MTKKQIKQLEKAGKKLEKCGGDCHHCNKCHIYTRWTERAGYMAVGCDLLPSELYDYIASVPSQLHSAAVELVKFELSKNAIASPTRRKQKEQVNIARRAKKPVTRRWRRENRKEKNYHEKNYTKSNP